MNEMFSLGWTLFTVTKLHWCKLNIPLLFLQWSRQLPPRRYLVSSHISQLKSVQTWWMVSLSCPAKNWVRIFSVRNNGPWLEYYCPVLVPVDMTEMRDQQLAESRQLVARVDCWSAGWWGEREMLTVRVSTLNWLSSPAPPAPQLAGSACRGLNKNNTMISNKER